MADLATEAFFRYGDDQPMQDTQNISTTGYQTQSMQNSYIVRSPAVTGSNQGSFLGTPIPQGLVFYNILEKSFVFSIISILLSDNFSTLFCQITY